MKFSEWGLLRVDARQNSVFKQTEIRNNFIHVTFEFFNLLIMFMNEHPRGFFQKSWASFILKVD